MSKMRKMLLLTARIVDDYGSGYLFFRCIASQPHYVVHRRWAMIAKPKAFLFFSVLIWLESVPLQDRQRMLSPKKKKKSRKRGVHVRRSTILQLSTQRRWYF